MTDHIEYIRERALVLKEEIDDLLASIGLERDLFRADQVAVNMETEVCRIRWALSEELNDQDGIDWYSEALEIHEIGQILMLETLSEKADGE